MTQLGLTTIGVNAQSLISNEMLASKWTCAATEVVQSITIYVGGQANTSMNVTGAVWADSSTAPGALLGTFSAIAISSNQAIAWQTANVVTPFTVTSGTVYWIGCGGSTGSPSAASVKYDTSTGSKYDFQTGASNPPTNPFGTASVIGANLSQSVYITTAVVASAQLPFRFGFR